MQKALLFLFLTFFHLEKSFVLALVVRPMPSLEGEETIYAGATKEESEGLLEDLKQTISRTDCSISASGAVEIEGVQQGQNRTMQRVMAKFDAGDTIQLGSITIFSKDNLVNMQGKIFNDPDFTETIKELDSKEPKEFFLALSKLLATKFDTQGEGDSKSFIKVKVGNDEVFLSLKDLTEKPEIFKSLQVDVAQLKGQVIKSFVLSAYKELTSFKDGEGDPKKEKAVAKYRSKIAKMNSLLLRHIHKCGNCSKKETSNIGHFIIQMLLKLRDLKPDEKSTDEDDAKTVLSKAACALRAISLECLDEDGSFEKEVKDYLIGEKDPWALECINIASSSDLSCLLDERDRKYNTGGWVSPETFQSPVSRNSSRTPQTPPGSQYHYNPYQAGQNVWSQYGTWPYIDPSLFLAQFQYFSPFISPWGNGFPFMSGW